MSKPDDVHIPESILLAAQRAQDAAIEECNRENYLRGFGSGYAKVVLDKHIALALLAEREACAQIVDAAIEAKDEDIAGEFRSILVRIASAQRYALTSVASTIRTR